MSARRERVLVLGGTGLLGGAAVRALSKDGYSVRVMTRRVASARERLDGEVDLVEGDLTDLAGLRRAMDGCFAVHISVGGPVDQLSAENVCRLAPASGVGRISYVSGATVCEENAWFPMVAQKLAAERAVRESGVPFTIFRPTWAMEMLGRFVRDGRPIMMGKQRARVHWYAADELGRMVSTAYGVLAAVGRSLYIHGPEGIPMREALQRYCAHFHPRVAKVRTIPVGMAKLLASVTGNAELRYAAKLMGYFDEIGEMGDPTEANSLLGAPTMRLGEWMASFESVSAARFV